MPLILMIEKGEDVYQKKWSIKVALCVCETQNYKTWKRSFKLLVNKKIKIKRSWYKVTMVKLL